MPTNTTNYALVKPALTDSPPDITAMNQNWDAIDVELKNHDDKLKNLSAYAVASGTNTYTATISGIAALTEGMGVKIKFTNANTGASTLNINNLGAKIIKKGNGNDLASGNIKAGQICNLAYTGSNFQLLGEGGEYGTATAADVLEEKTIGTENGLVAGTMVNRGSVGIQNLTTDGAEYTIPNGYHNGLGKVKAVISGLVASVIKAGTTVGGILGTFTSDATATAAQILTGAIAYVNGNKITGTMINQGAKTLTPGASAVTIPAGYHNGSGIVSAVSNLSAGNIKDGVNVGGVVGNSVPLPTPSTSSIAFVANGTTGLKPSSSPAINATSVTTTDKLFTISASLTCTATLTSNKNFYCKYGTDAVTEGTSYSKALSTSGTLLCVYNPSGSTITINLSANADSVYKGTYLA